MTLDDDTLTVLYEAYVKLNIRVLDRRLPPRLEKNAPFSVLLRGVRRFQTDVSGLPIGPALKEGPTGSPETSVSNHLTPRNNPEDGRIKAVYISVIFQNSKLNSSTD
jgi:hypothetical protein